jgi:hypothetical protein
MNIINSPDRETYMDYFKHYDKMIERARYRDIHGYAELHHVIPRCMGGTDDKNNLVRLTPEEHYLAHQLLVKMYPHHDGLVAAAFFMCTRPSNKLYGWLKRKRSQEMQTNNPNKDGKARKEYIRKNGPVEVDRSYITEEYRNNCSVSKLGDLNPNKDGKVRMTITHLVSVVDGSVLMYDSLKDAELEHKANHASVHYNRKRKKAYRGYYWYVGNEYNEGN